MKLFIKLRKKLILPIRWFFSRKKKIREIKLKTVKEVLDKRDEITDDLLRAERIEDKDEIEIQKGRLMLINYILNE